MILDPFCGSGTTGVISAKLGRRFVGFDLDESYLQTAQKRIEDEIHTSATRLNFKQEIESVAQA